VLKDATSAPNSSAAVTSMRWPRCPREISRVASASAATGLVTSLATNNETQVAINSTSTVSSVSSSMYMLLLTLLTVLVLFIATWVSLFVAKLVTKPVAALAEATREISLGHLGHRIDVTAADELGALVASFN